jgi:hypothetical protein
MSQHDYQISNDTGQAVRLDINNALAAIVSQNSGATEPSTTFAYQWWMDTTTGLLKIRNAANDNWVTLGNPANANFGLLSLAGGTLTGALLAAVGAVGTPGVTFDGDPDTGIYRQAANAMGLVAGGVEVLRVQADPDFLISTAVKLPTGNTAARPTGAAGHIRYNSQLNQFEGFNGSVWGGLGGGGGGGGIKWSEVGGTSPIQGEEFSDLVYQFAAGLSQELYTTIAIPQSYSGGTQISLYIPIYSPSTSNTVSMRSQATLIRKNNDAFSSTTNQRTSTNSAITNTVANQLREIILDLTDSAGAINSVAVSAGDRIKVRLYRDTDTDTADVRFLPNGTDIKFS